MKAALYIHVPFCRKKCPYCDFYSIVKCDAIPVYLQALEREIEYYAKTKWTTFEFSTIYWGGGTPSLLTPEQISTILNRLYGAFRIVPNAEITLEANPGTLFEEHVPGYRDAGINRLSLGAQSFSDKELCTLGRIHNAQQAERAVEMAVSSGFSQIGVDLIFGVPGQSDKDWRYSLDRAIEFMPHHLSVYGLTYEPGTSYDSAVKAGHLVPVSEEQERSMFLDAQRVLSARDYVQYELSNYAKPGCRSRHNQMYWNGEAYLGLGPGSHSFYPPDHRMWLPRNVMRYASSLIQEGRPLVQMEYLSREQQLFELIMLNLRKREGLSLKVWQEKAGNSFLKQFESVINDLGMDEQIKPFESSNRGSHFVIQPDRLALSAQGMLLYDNICEKLINCI